MNLTLLVTTYKLTQSQIIVLLNTMNIFCDVILRNQTNINSKINVSLQAKLRIIRHDLIIHRNLHTSMLGCIEH